MKKVLLLVLYIFANVIHVHAQQQIKLTQNTQISVLTIAPGNELVDSFGHSAFRVRDPFLRVDYVYNYGTYDFNTPNFLTKFAQGKLLYILSIARYKDFINDYSSQNRTVVEQILNLTKEEKQHFFEFLQNNARDENRAYLYDFFFDNCATKLYDVSNEILEDKIQFNYTFNELDFTFRDLIRTKLEKQPWGEFGIDLALGSVIDRKATPKEYLFLPEYVFKSFKKSTIRNKPLVRIERTLFESKSTETTLPFFTPILVFSLIAIAVILVTLRDVKKKKRSRWLDVIVFLFTGIVGLVVLLLWFATDHSATQKNFNILWAVFLNLPIAFFFIKKQPQSWIKKYVIFLIILLLVTALLWILKIQIFAVAIVPILVLLLLRYLYLIKFLKNIK